MSTCGNWNSKARGAAPRQEQMSHDQRLQLMGTLTGGIAHEFNNLLTPIMGYSGMIMADSDPSEDVYDSAQEIYSAAEKAKDIIRQIAALSRSSRGSNVKPLNLKAAAGAPAQDHRHRDSAQRPHEHLVRSGGRLFCPLQRDGAQPDRLKSVHQRILRHAQQGWGLRLGGRVITGEEAGLLFHARGTRRPTPASGWRITGGNPPRSNRLIYSIPFFTTKQVGEGHRAGAFHRRRYPGIAGRRNPCGEPYRSWGQVYLLYSRL